MLVSIIIPCYNGVRYIPGLAQSLVPVLAAGRGEYEVIFVDDGSADASAELARQHLPGARFVQQPNRGLSAARNAGVAVATGEYLQLLDVDDTIEPDKLAAQAGAATAAAADVVYSDWRLLTIDGGKVVRTEVFAPAQAPCEMVEAILSGWSAPPVSYLFRRSAYLELGGSDENTRAWGDFDLFLRFSIASRPHVYVPGTFSNYYRYLDVKSLARRDLRANALEREMILRNATAAMKEQKTLTPPRRRAAAKALFGVLRTAGISDRAWLQNMAQHIHDLDPSFRPAGPVTYRALARTLGLVTAERIALALRGFRGQRAEVGSQRSEVGSRWSVVRSLVISAFQLLAFDPALPSDCARWADAEEFRFLGASDVRTVGFATHQLGPSQGCPRSWYDHRIALTHPSQRDFRSAATVPVPQIVGWVFKVMKEVKDGE